MNLPYQPPPPLGIGTIVHLGADLSRPTFGGALCVPGVVTNHMGPYVSGLVEGAGDGHNPRPYGFAQGQWHRIEECPNR